MNTFIIWQDAYSLKEVNIDNQHKQIIMVINEIYSVLKTKGNEEILKVSLNKLIDYTDKHFQYEEEIMKTINFPGIPEHKTTHRNMEIRTREIVRECLSNKNITVIFELFNYLKEWWTGHVRGKDVQYVVYLEKYWSANK